MKTVFFKGLIAAIIASLSTLLAIDDAGIVFYTVSILGTVIVYFAQNAIVKPVSLFGTIDLTDAIKGVLFAVGTAVSTYAASVITATQFNWPEIWQVISSAFLLYLSKNLFSNSGGTIGTEKK